MILFMSICILYTGCGIQTQFSRKTRVKNMKYVHYKYEKNSLDLTGPKIGKYRVLKRVKTY